MNKFNKDKLAEMRFKKSLKAKAGRRKTTAVKKEEANL